MSIKIEDLGLGFEGQILFDGLCGEVKTGESLAILGCNGTGKSSILRAFAGILKPKSGNINFNNISHDISYLPQNINIRRDIPINVTEYVKFAALSKNKISQEKINEIFQLLDIKNIENDVLTNISGGQLVLVCLARIALDNSKIIILDEPFASLDKDKTNILLSLIAKWQQEGRIIIVSIHDDRLAKGFNHFLTLDGKNAYWEQNCPNHSENCVLSHQHNHFHHHHFDGAQ